LLLWCVTCSSCLVFAQSRSLCFLLSDFSSVLLDLSSCACLARSLLRCLALGEIPYQFVTLRSEMLVLSARPSWTWFFPESSFLSRGKSRPGAWLSFSRHRYFCVEEGYGRVQKLTASVPLDSVLTVFAVAVIRSSRSAARSMAAPKEFVLFCFDSTARAMVVAKVPRRRSVTATKTPPTRPSSSLPACPRCSIFISCFLPTVDLCPGQLQSVVLPSVHHPGFVDSALMLWISPILMLRMCGIWSSPY
jgi:hypothetical protein